MKTMLIIMVCLIWSIVSVTGQQFPDANYLVPVDHQLYIPDMDNPWIGFPSHSIFLVGAYYNGYQIVDAYDGRTYIYTASDIRIADDGYIYVSTGEDKEHEPFLVLMGGDIILHFSNKYLTKPELYFGGQEARMGPFLVGGPEWAYYMFSIKDIKKTGDLYENNDTGLWNDGIKAIRVWSILTETIKGEKITYGPERMRHPFYDWGDMKINFNNASLFWAEGEPGPGIGGKIVVEFTRETDHVMVLNGAIDLSRRYLYKANNRLKQITIESESPRFVIEYSFEDIVQFHKINLPQKTSKIIITIKDVYKGSKWDDTCISAIFLKQEPMRLRSDYDKIIEEYIKRRGFDKKIAEYNAKRKLPKTN
ncbi:NADase-type glycan-binding domain-containing protein [Gracilinema caldarium]|uniref:NAD glycohydrolase translocation F5/8 type C domain-containing protein n=1 Tax=Gracilinema caldarium (strain ATCC 51460 / DSM 7334 / H1) TaxID=744872 RepID=F8EYZ2_GRAC1|nr:hypothetical protein [Gracilinema caldarium]AEJ19223.1 hypothetical protein Spica_1075 [Gracilinema caldarium DSM 7334]